MNGDNWQERLGMGRAKPRAFTPGQIVQYDNMAASLIQESSLPAIIGSLEDFERTNPALHQELMQLCRMAATFEIGEATQMIPPGSSAETYRKMAALLDDCMAINPRFEGMPPEEMQREAAKAAVEFKAVCHRETTDPNGIVACTLKNALSQLHQPVTELVPSGRS